MFVIETVEVDTRFNPKYFDSRYCPDLSGLSVVQVGAAETSVQGRLPTLPLNTSLDVHLMFD